MASRQPRNKQSAVTSSKGSKSENQPLEQLSEKPTGRRQAKSKNSEDLEGGSHSAVESKLSDTHPESAVYTTGPKAKSVDKHGIRKSAYSCSTFAARNLNSTDVDLTATNPTMSEWCLDQWILIHFLNIELEKEFQTINEDVLELLHIILRRVSIPEQFKHRLYNDHHSSRSGDSRANDEDYEDFNAGALFFGGEDELVRVANNIQERAYALLARTPAVSAKESEWRSQIWDQILHVWEDRMRKAAESDSSTKSAQNVTTYFQERTLSFARYVAYDKAVATTDHSILHLPFRGILNMHHKKQTNLDRHYTAVQAQKDKMSFPEILAITNSQYVALSQHVSPPTTAKQVAKRLNTEAQSKVDTTVKPGSLVRDLVARIKVYPSTGKCDGVIVWDDSNCMWDHITVLRGKTDEEAKEIILATQYLKTLSDAKGKIALEIPLLASEKKREGSSGKFTARNQRLLYIANAARFIGEFLGMTNHPVFGLVSCGNSATFSAAWLSPPDTGGVIVNNVAINDKTSEAIYYATNKEDVVQFMLVIFRIGQIMTKKIEDAYKKIDLDTPLNTIFKLSDDDQPESVDPTKPWTITAQRMQFPALEKPKKEDGKIVQTVLGDDAQDDA